jgi:hypothetical protein
MGEPPDLAATITDDGPAVVAPALEARRPQSLSLGGYRRAAANTHH